MAGKEDIIMRMQVSDAGLHGTLNRQLRADGSAGSFVQFIDQINLSSDQTYS